MAAKEIQYLLYEDFVVNKIFSRTAMESHVSQYPYVSNEFPTKDTLVTKEDLDIVENLLNENGYETYP